MDKTERFARRLYLMEHMDLWLKESAYHRAHEDDENIEPNLSLWSWGEEEGVVSVVTAE